MLLSEVTYLVQQERYADLRRAAERARLVKAVERKQQWRATERWYSRYLFPLFFTIGVNVANR
ncbi:MAG: hypothetical protein DYG89_17135 [Caldilinea sp. CFX5]|nr:hypothetical protein [Caldilinea sp. CFX5]